MKEQNFELKALMEYNSAEEFFDSDRYMLIDLIGQKITYIFTVNKPAIIMLLVKKILPQKFQKFQKLQKQILQKLLYVSVKLFKTGNMLKNS